MLKSILLFVLAGIAEIAGGYFVWLWLREGKPLLWGLIGGIVLMVYGIIPTFQAENNFGRIYAAYGGIFIILSTFWGWWVEGKHPDVYDWAGAAICLVGVSIIMWGPRGLH